MRAADAAVLRQAALGDVEPGHDLTREITAAVRFCRRRFAFRQHAVDAVAHLQPVLERLDVDVRGAQFDRALDDEVDRPDHRRLEARSRRCSTSSMSPPASPSALESTIATHRAAPWPCQRSTGRRFPNAARSLRRAPRARWRAAPRPARIPPADRRQHVDRGRVLRHLHQVELLHEARAQAMPAGGSPVAILDR